MKSGDKVIINREGLIRTIGKINHIISNANSFKLYCVISDDREYYCKEGELEIIR